MARRTLITEAKPISLKFSDKDGYFLVVKVTDGPQHLLDRLIKISMTAQQLGKIAGWHPNENRILDLE